MKTSMWDVLQAARSFAGKVHLEVDMEKSVNIPLRTAVLVSHLADEFLAKLQAKNTELERQLRLGTVPNRANAQDELHNNFELIYMLENNCIETLHQILDTELHPKK